MKIEELDRVRRAEELQTGHLETLRSLRESMSLNQTPEARWLVLRYTELIKELVRKRDITRGERDRLELMMKGDRHEKEKAAEKDYETEAGSRAAEHTENAAGRDEAAEVCGVAQVQGPVRSVTYRGTDYNGGSV